MIDDDFLLDTDDFVVAGSRSVDLNGYRMQRLTERFRLISRTGHGGNN